MALNNHCPSLKICDTATNASILSENIKSKQFKLLFIALVAIAKSCFEAKLVTYSHSQFGFIISLKTVRNIINTSSKKSFSKTIGLILWRLPGKI